MKEINPNMTVYLDMDALITTLIRFNRLYWPDGKLYFIGYKECMEDLEILGARDTSTPATCLDKCAVLNALIKLSRMELEKKEMNRTKGYRDCLVNLEILEKE